MKINSELKLLMDYTIHPEYKDIFEIEIEKRIRQMGKVKPSYKQIYEDAEMATKHYIQKRIQIQEAMKKPKKEKILTWNPNLIAYHANKKKAQRKQQDREVRKAMIEMNVNLEEVIQIKNIKVNNHMEKNIITTVINVKDYPLTENSVKVIGDFVWNQLQKVIAGINQNNYPGGFNTGVMLYLRDPDSEKSASFGLKNPTRNDVNILLAKKSGNQYNTALYILYLSYITILIAKLPNNGGCRNGKSVVNKLKVSSTKLIKLQCLKSTNNNCLIQCFIKGCTLKGNQVKADIVRQKVGLPLNTKIHLSDIPKISDYFQKGYILINQNYDIIGQKKYKDPTDYLLLYLKDEHYYLAEVIETLEKCPICGDQNIKTKTHKCNLKQTSFYQKQKCKKHNMVSVRNIEKPKINYDDVIHFDLETFQPTTHHEPYACGWYNKEYKVKYGKDCIDTFIADISKMEKKIISAYNGSGFDFFMLIRKITDMGITVEDIILTNGKVMTFKFGNENRIFDLYLFINSSLDKACKDFKIKNAKSSFDHTKIKTWDDVDKHEKEVLPYLKLDVLGLKELFETFSDMIYEMKHINITNYVTLSHMAYEIWASMLTNVVEIPNNLEKYDFIKQGTYGGRCYPMQKRFKSKHYDDVVNKNMTYKQLLETGDFIFNADATSLYPASMKGTEHLQISYPTGNSRWSNNPNEEWKNGKIGFYKITFCPPKDIRTPILPRKINLGIRWSLEDGVGVYTSVDIQNSIDAGYKVEFIEKCLVWDSSSDVFGQYIEEFYKLKEDAEREGNNVKRSIAKLMMNALYGKTLQKAIFNKTAIVNNIFEFNNFLIDKNTENFNWIVLSDNKMLLSGEVKDEIKGSQITKPCQLGAFVTANSRKLMLFYIKAIDPTLKSMPFTYTDTDSLHIHGYAYIKLKELGYIKPKASSALGYLCSDIDDEGIIIKEKNLAPKTYNYEYINDRDEVYIKDTAVMKCKGIPKRCLKSDYYESEVPTEVQFNGLKKKHKTLTKNDVKQGVQHFSIVNSEQTRTFNKSEWQGMIFKENSWYPFGFIFN